MFIGFHVKEVPNFEDLQKDFDNLWKTDYYFKFDTVNFEYRNEPTKVYFEMYQMCNVRYGYVIVGGVKSCQLFCGYVDEDPQVCWNRFKNVLTTDGVDF